MIQEIKVTENFDSANHEGGLRDDDRDLGRKQESEFLGVEYSDAESGGNSAQNPLLFFYNNGWDHAKVLSDR
eukprot:1462589-Ditylum_brightwellii.AAC.1